jgi:hypothetical protein
VQVFSGMLEAKINKKRLLQTGAQDSIACMVGSTVIAGRLFPDIPFNSILKRDSWLTGT